MGRYKNGIGGKFSGKVGNVVGASCRGVDYMRNKPKPSTKPATPAQLNQRLKFAMVMNWLRPMLELINIGFQFFTGSKTAMNGAISFHLKEAIAGEGPDYNIDFSKAIFSRGELLVSWLIELLSLLNGVLKVKWDDGLPSALCKDDDKATFIVYNPSKEQFVTFQHAALRVEKEVTLQLPKTFAGDRVYCWMQYESEKGDAVSTSVFLGNPEIV